MQAKGKVVRIIDPYTIISNLGSDNSNIRLGQKFKIIKLGDPVIDPDTNEELGQLEIPCGTVEITHIQQKMSTMESCEYHKSPDRKEIKITHPNAAGNASSFLTMFRNIGETIETIVPGAESKKSLGDVSVGDIIIPI